jgi:hypothetical protein
MSDIKSKVVKYIKNIDFKIIASLIASMMLTIYTAQLMLQDGDHDHDQQYHQMEQWSQYYIWSVATLYSFFLVVFGPPGWLLSVVTTFAFGIDTTHSTSFLFFISLTYSILCFIIMGFIMQNQDLCVKLQLCATMNSNSNCDAVTKKSSSQEARKALRKEAAATSTKNGKHQ